MDTTELSLRVWDPVTGAVYKVKSIASNEEHIGNLVAEGKVSKDDYYQHLASTYKGQLATANGELARIHGVVASARRLLASAL